MIKRTYRDALLWPNEKEGKYDEDLMMTCYVWEYCRSLMTELEGKVGKVILVRAKAEAIKDPAYARRLLTSWGLWGHPQIEVALKDGPKSFRHSVKDRLLREHSDQLVINRCPRCDRIVRTPTAKLCLWCGHSWHPRPSPPPDSQASEHE